MMLGSLLLSSCSNNHEHKFGDAYKHDEHNHWVECECGEKKDVTSHIWDEGTLTKQASLAEDGEFSQSCICGAKKVTKVDSLAKSAKNMNVAPLEYFGEGVDKEEYERLTNRYQIRVSDYLTLSTGTTYYFSFEKESSNDVDLIYYSIGVLQKGEEWDEIISNKVTFRLYSSNDLNNPIVVKEYNESYISFDDPNPLANEKYYLEISIYSFAGEAYLNNIILTAGYGD